MLVCLSSLVLITERVKELEFPSQLVFGHWVGRRTGTFGFLLLSEKKGHSLVLFGAKIM